MMTRNRSERKALGKYTLAVPAFIFLLVFFISPKNGLMAKTEDFSESLIDTVNEIEDKIESEIQNNNQANENIKHNLSSHKVDTTNNPQNYGFFDPKVRLGGKLEGVISQEIFRKQIFLDLLQPMYDTPITCKILNFKLIRIPFGSETKQELTNISDKFTDETLKLVQQAENGDTYQFTDIRGIYSGDAVPRFLNDCKFIIGENMEDLLRVKTLEISQNPKAKIPQPFPTLNGLRGSFIEIKKFKELYEIIPYEKNEFGYLEPIPKSIGEIESFTIRIKDKDSHIFCNGSHFNEAAKKLISDAEQGDTYHLENIIFKMNNGALLKWNLGEMYFNIKKVPIIEWSTRAEWFINPLPPINMFREIPADAELLTCTIYHYAKGDLKPSGQVNFSGFTWSEQASHLFQKAQIGDIYEFTDIKIRRRGHTNIENFASIRYKLN